MARAVHSEAQQCRTAASSASSPRTSRNVSCWPAKLASSRSSAVADERTATDGPSSLRAASSSPATSSGIGGGEQGADAGRRTVRPLRVGEGGEDPLADAGGGDVRPVRVGGEHDAGRDRQAGPGQLAEVRALAAREREIAAPDIGQLPEVPHGTSVDLPTDKMPPQRSGSATPGRGCGRRGGETIRPAGGTAAPPPRPSARTAGRPATSCRAARARGSRRARRRPAAA